MKIRAEENLGILIALGGLGWAAFQLRQYLLHVSPLWFRAEPLEGEPGFLGRAAADMVDVRALSWETAWIDIGGEG